LTASNKITCVFVHGWAMNSSVWESCLQFLPDWMEVIRVDLPGHGDSAGVDVNSIDDYVQALSSVTDRPVIWVGWSLGGLAVLRLARLYPELVAGLFMVATSPCFVRKQDWQAAIELNIFEQFAQDLRQDVDATVKRFLALQVKGSNTAMKNLRALHQANKTHRRPSAEALNFGLDMLARTDLRTELSLLKCPVTWLLGEHDELVPVMLAEELKQSCLEINVLIEREAAHVPFISHPQSFAGALISLAEKIR